MHLKYTTNGLLVTIRKYNFVFFSWGGGGGALRCIQDMRS